jgi:SAM-dependent methyltransferase
VTATDRRFVRLDHATRPAAVVGDERVVGSSGPATWVESRSAGVAQLRFADRAQGSLCLEPSWAALADLSRTVRGLEHLAPPKDRRDIDAMERSPGTLTTTRYCLPFPALVELIPTRQPTPKVLVLGLGAGAGIAALAHHLPEAHLTVVELDAAVIELVHHHFPLFSFLAEGPAPLVTVVQADARRFVEATRRPAFDLVILDCWSPQGGIPPALLESAFFDILRRRALAPGGLLAVSLHGSYTGHRRKEVLACLDSLAQAGFSALRCLPMLDAPGTFDPSRGTNLLALAADDPLDPERAPDAWRRAAASSLYEGLDQVPRPTINRVEQAGAGATRSFVLPPSAGALLDQLDASPTPYGRSGSLPDDEVLRRALGLPPHSVGGWSFEQRDLLRYARWVARASLDEGAHARHTYEAVLSADQAEVD